MSFSVEPDALQSAATRIADASLDAQEAKAYIVKHTDMPVQSQGLLSEWWPAHERLVDAMDKRLTHLVELLNKSRDALDGTAQHYRRTDTGSAARLDATYPTVDRSGHEMPGGRPLSGNLP